MGGKGRIDPQSLYGLLVLWAMQQWQNPGHAWHWCRDTQIKEDAHRYRETNDVQIMATLRSLAMKALRLDGF